MSRERGRIAVGIGRDGPKRWTGDVVVRVQQAIAVAWLLALGQPIRELFQANPSWPVLSASLAGVAAFVIGYVWVVFRSAPYGVDARASDRPPSGTWRLDRERLRLWAPLAFLAALAVAYTAAFGGTWPDLLIFTGVAIAIRLPIQQSAWLVPAAAIASAALVTLVEGSPPAAGPIFLLILSIGIGVAGLLYAVATVRELRAAREEIARLAVAEERLRFARDLHDLLGHSLSLIALKSELAGQLAIAAPDRAAAEMRDVEGVAREALREVREAVAGYRRPTLAGELVAIGEILAAAGIRLRVEGEAGPLPPGIEAALAWSIREGVTNVIRHSRARACAIHLARNAEQVVVEVTDDGDGAGSPAPTGRSGLVGLAERVEAVGGRVEAGRVSPRGFRLRATVPLAGGGRAHPPTPSPVSQETREGEKPSEGRPPLLHRRMERGRG
jgi:two-component system sensor histidine kinase DesK